MKKLILATIFLASAAIADDLTIPNTFTAGTPAVAAEVNGNFTAVEASVDDNAADIAVTTVDIAANTASIADNQADIQSNSSSIAALAAGGGIKAFSEGIAIGSLVDWDLGPIELISDKGYFFAAPAVNGIPYLRLAGRFVYLEPDCAGQTYVSGISDLVAFGMVFRAPDSEVNGFSAYYVPRKAGGYIQLDYASILQFNGVCTNESLTEFGWAAFPNDEAITGVSNTAPDPTGLTFGVP